MITINLLPKHLRPIKRTPIPHILSILVLMAAVAGMGFIFLTLKAQVFIVQGELEALQSDLAELDGVVKEYNQLLEDEARLASRIKAIEEITRDRIIWSRQLYNLDRLAPDNLWYTEIGIDTKRVPKEEQVIGQDGKPMMDPATGRPRMRTVNVEVPVLKVRGYATPTPDGRFDTGAFARAAESDEEFSSLFQIEPPRIEDTVYEGYDVREFTFEFGIRKGGEES
jgi:hypothetical protein